MMTHVKDSFIKYLSDNLTGYTIKYLHHDPSDPGAELLALSAINVDFFDIAPALDGSVYRVSLDVVYNDDETAIEAVEDIFDLFKQSYFTPILDYTNVNAPVALGGNVYWDRDRVRFSKVPTQQYVHFNCILSLKYA